MQCPVPNWIVSKVAQIVLKVAQIVLKVDQIVLKVAQIVSKVVRIVGNCFKLDCLKGGPTTNQSLRQQGKRTGKQESFHSKCFCYKIYVEHSETANIPFGLLCHNA